tara:strand:- start:3067 stop:4194 length:1128 start_codon:yes stop_codon:yes gene_type:complete
VSNIIQFQEPYKSQRIKRYVEKSLKANYYSAGEFEEKCKIFLSENFGFKNTLITHSATGALEIAALLLKEKHINKTVYLPSYTFSSTANAFIRAGFKVEFLDINKNNMMINFKEASKKAAGNILVPVHYGGHSVDMDDASSFKKKGLLVEDAAQGLGTKWRNKQVGLFGNLSAISFHHTKNIQGGFAGLISINDKKYFERAKYIYERGTDRSKVIRGLKSKYEWVEIGSSFQVPDIISAIILAQLEEFNTVTKKRKEIYDFYSKYFSDEKFLEYCFQPKVSSNSKTNYHAFYLIFNTYKLAKDFIAFTKKRGVNCYIGYVPLHSSLKGKELKLNKILPVTEKYSKMVVRLPLHTNITKKDLKRIENVFNEFFIGT